MYEAELNGGRRTIARRKQTRSIPLQVLYSIRREHQWVEQISHNPLYSRFGGLMIKNEVLNHAVFSKNRDRLTAFDMITDLFHATGAQAHGPAMLSREQCVNVTLIQPWDDCRTLRPQEGSDDDQSPDDWCGQSRGTGFHALTSDSDSRFTPPYRKSDAVAALRCKRITVGVDKNRDTRVSFAEWWRQNTAPLVASKAGRRVGDIGLRTNRHDRYPSISMGANASSAGSCGRSLARFLTVWCAECGALISS